jgi:hypothetical protein
VLDDFDALLVTLLDGTRGWAALVETRARSVSDRTLQIHEGGRPARDPAKVRAVLAAALEPRRRQLARHALLVGS